MSLCGLFLVFISFFLVAFGQPAWVPLLGIISSCCGFALFWHAIIQLTPRQRFKYGTAWFTAVQLVQLSWLVMHPYLYIVPFYLLFAVGMGCQFGLLSMLIDNKRITRITGLLGLAGFWTLMEWIRLFALAGFSWNPVGLALTSTIEGLQGASLFGVFGLSFWVILTNLLALSWASFYKLSENQYSRASFRKWGTAWFLIALAPYLYGAV